jgi:multidrug efflux pump subunit AcrA (membrane-fusion protein)
LPAALRPRLSAFLAASITLVGLTASCGEDRPAVVLTNAARVTVAELVDAPATVTARAEATLSAPADGTLGLLRARPGDSVKAGQVLAVIDSPAAQARLKQAEQAIAAAERTGQVAAADGDLAGIQRKTDRAAAQEFEAAREAASKISDERQRVSMLAQVREAQRQYDSAARAANEAVWAMRRGVAGLNSAMSALSAAQRLQAQHAYDLAKATVDALTLRAPIRGVVQFGGTTTPAGSGDSLANLLGGAAGAVPGAGPVGVAGPVPPVAGVDGAVRVGGRLTAGTAVLTVVDLSDLGLTAQVDETDVLLVSPGVPATVELDAVTGASYPARVRSVDVLPTTSSRGGVSYRVRLSLEDGRFAAGGRAPTPRPGMSAVTHLRVREAADAVTVPATAVFSADGRDAVWVVRDGRADRVAVTVGVQGKEVVQIVAGVQQGEQVVAHGVDQVRTGQRVS